MAYTDFSKNLSRVKSRSGNAFLYDPEGDAGEVYLSLGIVRGISVNTEPVTSEQDSLGRSKTLSANVTVSLTLMQTGDEELSNIGFLADPSIADVDAWANGLTLVLTESGTTPSALEEAEYEGEKFTFTNCLPQVTLELDFNGETEGIIQLEIQGRIPISQLSNFGTTKTITFDAT